ncbi:helix-turn-helix domain-containing protein [Fusobacterium nucleatum]|uniref:helix-turn-helix domain-containing protein n=1 Tax=Fusobacterium nucleatum TaxID=851 RepID=UPI0030CA7E1E
MADIKDRIFTLRTENSLTQQQMAKIFKVGISTISMWEKGERIPRPKLLQELCDYFNVDMDYLMGRSDIKNRYQAGLKYDWENKKEEKDEVKTAARDKKVFDKYSKLDEAKRKIVEALIDSYFDENVEDEED